VHAIPEGWKTLSATVQQAELFLEVGVKDTTKSRTVTEADVVGFAGVSGDFHPLHTDEPFASQSQFGQRIAHGFLVLSIASGLLTAGARAPLNDEVKAFYGLDKVRLVRPTFFGDTLAVRWEVTERTPKGENVHVARVNCEVVNQNETTVAAFELLLLIGH
jgi:3-hydroxybutyryl-CoA dehydratase